jgi:hypothetical protein
VLDTRKVNYVNTIILVLVLGAIGFLIWWNIAQRDSRKANRTAWAAKAAEERQRADLEAQAKSIQQWQSAYALANPGQPIPAPPLVLGGAAYGSANRTNTMAILAIIFGFFGGILGIVFGYIALSQIRRTGEGGRGLAITGIAFGYFGVALATVLIIVDIVTLAQLHP